MKKHIIGFTIFSLIVGAAVFVKAICKTQPKTIIEVENVYDYTYATRNSCWKMKQKTVQTEIPVVRQAVFDLNTKQLDWELKVPNNGVPIALHFFKQERTGMKYIATEFAPVKTSLNSPLNESGALEFTSSYSWLDNLNSYENLYIVPQSMTYSEYRSKDFKPVFDDKSATSVLLYSGKDGYPTEKFFKK